MLQALYAQHFNRIAPREKDKNLLRKRKREERTRREAGSLMLAAAITVDRQGWCSHSGWGQSNSPSPTLAVESDQGCSSDKLTDKPMNAASLPWALRTAETVYSFAGREELVWKKAWVEEELDAGHY